MDPLQRARINPTIFEGRRFVGRIMEQDLEHLQGALDWLMRKGVITLDEEGAPVWTDAAGAAFRSACQRSYTQSDRW